MTESSHKNEQQLVEQNQQSFRANEGIPFLEAQQHNIQLGFCRDSSLHLIAQSNNNPQSSSTDITDQKETAQIYYISSHEQLKNSSLKRIKYPRTSSPTTPLQGDDETELALTYSPQQRNNKTELPPSNLSDQKQYPLPRIFLAENEDSLLPEGAIIGGRLQKQSADFQGNLSDLINTNECNEEDNPNAPNDSRCMSHMQSGDNSNYTSSFGISDIMFLSSKHKKTYNIQQKRLDSVAQSKDESLNKDESSPIKVGSYTFQNTSQYQSIRENNTLKDSAWNQKEGSYQIHKNNNNNTIKEISIGRSSQIANNNYKDGSNNMQDSMFFGVKSYHDEISEMHNAINTPKVKGNSIRPIWKKRFLSIIQKVARFLNIMIGHSRTKKFSYLRREDFQIIGDLACSYKYYLFNGFLENNKPSKYQKIMFAFSQKLKRNMGSFKMFRYMGVLKPYQTIKVVWDVIILILTFINIFIIPIMCFFEGFDQDKDWMGLIYLSCIMFVSDVFIKLNTAFFQHGVLQEKRKIIIQRYFQGEMIVDCVTLIPYVMGACGLSEFLLFVIVLKAFSMSKVRKHLMEVFQPSEVFQMIIRILNVFMLVLFIAHLTSSGFVWVATQQNKDQQKGYSVSTWITSNNLTNSEWNVLYLNGLYWAIISMITIGYGDITPITPMEKLYTIIISQIITDLKQRQKKLKERITNLNRFLMARNLDMHLQMKVRKFIEYLHYSEESEGQAIKDLELIPKSIREEVQIDIYGRMIRKIKLFHINFSSEAINNIALRVTESSFGPGEIVFKVIKNNECGLNCFLNCEIEVRREFRESIYFAERKDRVVDNDEEQGQ